MIGAVLYDAGAIRERVGQLGEQIGREYAGKMPMLVGVLNSAAVFLSDLSRAVPIPSEFDFIAVSKYAPSKSVRFEKDLAASVEGRHVLVVDDAIDTGLTLQYVMRTLRSRAPASIEVCTLLDRPRHRIADIDVKYRGFEIPETFVVGYGLDYQGLYRELPDLHVHVGWPN